MSATDEQKALVNEALLLRGRIIACYSQIEFLLADISVKLDLRFPYRIQDRIKAARRIVDREGYGDYKAELEAICDQLLAYDDIRHFMAHGFLTLTTDKKGNHQFEFLRYEREGEGKFKLLQGKTEVERLRAAADDITEYTEKAINLFRRIYSEKGVETANMTESQSDPHKEFLDALGPGLKEWVEPLPPVPSHPAAYFESLLDGGIGSGSSREVFAVKDRPNAVIKKCKLPFIGANMFEFFVWNAVRGGPWKDIFGEVLEISEDGKYLMMERLDDISRDEYVQTPSAPDWTNDLQPKNFGKSVDGNIKVRDYAMCNISEALGSAKTYRYAWQLKDGNSA